MTLFFFPLGSLLCMNAPVDPALLQLVQQHLNTLETDVDNLAFEVEDDRKKVKEALQNIKADLEELERRVSKLEQRVKRLQDDQSGLDSRLTSLKSDQERIKCSLQRARDEHNAMGETVQSLNLGQEDLQQRVTQVEEQLCSAIPQITCGNSICFIIHLLNVVK